MATAPNPIVFRRVIKKMPGVQRVIDLSVVVEDWWFDFHYRVDTSSEFEAQVNRGWPKDHLNFHYLPIRPKCARRILRNLPVKNRREYTFIDFGSGTEWISDLSQYFFRRARLKTSSHTTASSPSFRAMANERVYSHPQQHRESSIAEPAILTGQGNEGSDQRIFVHLLDRQVTLRSAP